MSTDDTRAGAVAAEEVAFVVCRDPEQHAASFNEGYEAAVTQGLADDPTLAQDWLDAHDARVRAEALNGAADEIQAMHPGEVKNSVTFLRERAGFTAARVRAADAAEIESLRTVIAVRWARMERLWAMNDDLRTEAETQHRLRVEAEQHARDADRERDRVAAEVERFAESLEQADADCGSCSQRLAHAARLRKILTPVDTRTCGCAGIPQQVCDICQGVALLAPADDGDHSPNCGVLACAKCDREVPADDGGDSHG